MRHVAIVGGGISGLTTAFYLHRHGIPCTVFEEKSRFGGLIQTETMLGSTIEAGPDSFIATKPALRQLAEDLGIAGDLIGSNDAQRQIFIFRDGRLLALPRGMSMMVPTDMDAALASPLFSEATKQRCVAELESTPRQRNEDFSVRNLVEDHFGSELLEYVAEPLLAGVYGGDPGALSAPSVLPRFVEYESVFGSLIAGAQKERRTDGSLFLSFRNGMGQLIEVLTAKLRESVRIQTERVTAISDLGREWRIRTPNAEHKATDLVLSVPAHTAVGLLQPLHAGLADELRNIPYSSAILIPMLFHRDEIDNPMSGFGFLVPRPERQLISAATWINTKFPSRVAPEITAIRIFIVDPEASACARKSDAELLAAAQFDLQRLTGIRAKPLETAVYRWPDSMPQYVVGHERRRASILQEIQQFNGLHLVSNYLDGVGLPDCVRWARATAAAIRDRFRVG